MRFAVAILNQGFPDFTRRVRRAEELGFDRVCFGDSQSLFRDAWVSQAVMAAATERVGLWTTVTNTVTRHLAVTAGAAASLDELSGGRFTLGIGTGDSALGNIGAAPVSVDVLREAIVGLRRLWAGEEITWEEKPARLLWAQRPVPISIAAEGPRTLRLAGELSDEVCVGLGLDDASVGDAMALLAEGAQLAGRDREDVDTWFFAKTNIGDTVEAAMADIKMSFASSANHAFRGSFEGKRVPEPLQERIRAVQRNYQYAKHQASGPNPNADLLDDPELLAFLGERFALAGPVDHIVTRLRRLEELGVDGVLLTAIGPDPDAILERFGREVLPRFGTG